MSTGKSSVLPRGVEDDANGVIADWLNNVGKREVARTDAFRRTLDSLLGS